MGSLSIPCLVPLPSGAVSLSGAGTFLMRVIELATNSSSFSLPYAFPFAVEERKDNCPNPPIWK
jgi:hypothetical protein